MESASRTVFECSDLRGHIFNYIITKFKPHIMCNIRLCAKILRYYKNDLIQFSFNHSEGVYCPVKDENEFDPNTDNYLLKFIKFSEGFQKVENNMDNKFPGVKLFMNSLSLARFTENMVCITIGLRIDYSSFEYKEIDMKKLLTKELIKLNEPWVSFISEDYKFKNNINELEIMVNDIII